MSRTRVIGLAAVALVLAAAGCKDEPTEPAEFPSEGEVFLDQYGDNVTYQAFAESKYDAVQIDQVDAYAGNASLRVTVPAPGDPSGGFAGGAFTTDVARDLTEFDALTFWTRASTAATLDVAGLGNDNTGTSRFMAERRDIPVTTSWTKVVIPVPLASRLDQEEGLFFFAEGPEGDQGNTIWFDEVQYETLGTLANPLPVMLTKDVSVEVGGTVNVESTSVTFDVAGTPITVLAAPGYFTFTSSDEAVATVDADGVITVVGDGTATITGALGGVDATGSVTVTAVSPPQAAAPTPTAPDTSVISLFSNAYTNVAVDTWSADWDDADVADVQVQGDDTKRYTNLTFAGIEFTSAPVDASAMTRFHMDIWTPDPTADPAAFKVKLVDFGADGAYAGGDDSESELTFTANTTPALATGSWVSIDVPMSDFAGLATRSALAQMIISGDPNTVYVDNIYFYDDGSGGGGAATVPEVAAPTPTAADTSVISLYSDAYTDVPVNTYLAVWSTATLTDTAAAGDNVMKYGSLDVAGIEFTGTNSIDASGMTHVHMDVWTPNATSFAFKFVDFGADNAYGGGDDSENAPIELNASSTPALATGSWVSVDVPLSDLTSAGLASLQHLSQLVLVGLPTGSATAYVDNIYFYDDGSGGGSAATVPEVAAPTPTAADTSVISLYSDAYTDVPVDAYLTSWSAATLTDTTAAGDNVMKYGSLDFAGVEFAGPNSIDATGMTHVHMDVWTPNATYFAFKLVDFGVDNAYGGGDDSENAPIELDASSSPALATGSWVSIDVPLSDLTSAGLASLEHLSQLVITGQPTGSATVFVDNIYFYDDGSAGAATAPDVAAPTPTAADTNVISLYSDAYTDVPVDAYLTSWSAATLTDTTAAGDNVMKYGSLDFAGVEFQGPNSIDASGMTHVHMDVWTPNATWFAFKFVDFGADNAYGGGDDSENALVELNASSTPALTTGGWVSIDVALSDLMSAGLASVEHLSQLVITGQPTGSATVYVDNIYFYK